MLKKTMLLAICFILNSLLLLQAVAAEKLIFAIDIIRHGDRTPVINMPKSPEQWQALGQLTATGMRQEYHLGEKFRSLYVDHYHLLPAHYVPGTLAIRATDLDRTLMSAESLLLGLYPLGTGPALPGSSASALPGAYQPIPIRMVPRDQERLLIPDVSFYHFKDLQKRYMQTNKEWQEKTNQLAPKFPVWSKITGVKIKNLIDMIALADVLHVNQLYHIPLPADLTEADANEIIAAGQWAFATIFKSKMISHRTGQLLFNTIATAMNEAQLQDKPLKYMLFSAHDSTILNQMSLMGVPLNEIPPYSSDLKYVLIEKDNHRYLVRITLNDKAVYLPGCGRADCTLAAFVKLAHDAKTIYQ